MRVDENIGESQSQRSRPALGCFFKMRDAEAQVKRPTGGL